ncbi:hypothetical protein DPSP01_000070 [Paraphaeosphaeria sporulosa]
MADSSATLQITAVHADVALGSSPMRQQRAALDACRALGGRVHGRSLAPGQHQHHLDSDTVLLSSILQTSSAQAWVSIAFRYPRYPPLRIGTVLWTSDPSPHASISNRCRDTGYISICQRSDSGAARPQRGVHVCDATSAARSLAVSRPRPQIYNVLRSLSLGHASDLMYPISISHFEQRHVVSGYDRCEMRTVIGAYEADSHGHILMSGAPNVLLRSKTVRCAGGSGRGDRFRGGDSPAARSASSRFCPRQLLTCNACTLTVSVPFHRRSPSICIPLSSGLMTVSRNLLCYSTPQQKHPHGGEAS